MNRRTFLQTPLAASAGCGLLPLVASAAEPAADFGSAVEKAHAEIWRRVIDRIDYTRLYYCTLFWVESAWWRLVAAK